MVRRLAVTGVAAAVMVAGLLAWQVRGPSDDEGKIRRLPLSLVR